MTKVISKVAIWFCVLAVTFFIFAEEVVNLANKFLGFALKLASNPEYYWSELSAVWFEIWSQVWPVIYAGMQAWSGLFMNDWRVWGSVVVMLGLTFGAGITLLDDVFNYMLDLKQRFLNRKMI